MMKDFQRAETGNSIGRTIVLVMLYFLYLYSFQVPGLSIGTVLPVLGVLSLYAVVLYISGRRIEKTTTDRMLKGYLWWNAFLLVYVFVLLQIYGKSDGTTPIRDYVQMLIILPLFYISGNLLFRNMEDFMRVLYIGAIIQSSIIIAALFVPSLSMGLFLLIPDGGYNMEHFGGSDMVTEVGYHIGLGVFTSAGSLKLAIGQIGACFYLMKSNKSKLFYHLTIFLLIAIASTVVSRTGLLISLAGLFAAFWAKSKQGGGRVFGFVVLLIFISVAGYFILTSVLPNGFAEDTFKRLIDIADRGAKDTYFAGYTGEVGDNVIPKIGPNTIIGLGITYGISGSGIATITDGGFMRNYSAMGLIFAIINYMLIFRIFLRSYRRTKDTIYKGLIVYLFLVLFIGEFKEYYVYCIYPMCFILLTLSLMSRENINRTVPNVSSDLL